MTLHTRNVLASFADPAQADQAIEDLKNAGLDRDQIRSSGHSPKGGFLTGLKSLFTGENAATDTDVHNLTGTDVSEDEVRYYDHEEQEGHTVIAVQAAGHEQEVVSILRTHGATSYQAQRNLGSDRGTGAPYASAQQTSSAPRNVKEANAPQTSSAAKNINAAGSTASGRPSDATIKANPTGMQSPDTTRGMKSADMRAAASKNAPDTEDARAMKLREEQLEVTKQQAQTGEVTLHKDVIAEKKTINVPVSHEEVYIERHPVTDTYTDDTTPLGAGETIHVPVNAEQVNVSKDTVVTGEVSINKRTVEETQQVSDTVKHEEARIEQQGNVPLRDESQRNQPPPNNPPRQKDR